MISGRLYLVATPRERMGETEFLARISDALDGGVDVLQLRCKGWEALDYIKLAERVLPLAQRRGVPFIINDRPDVALAVGADGVHLGQKDLPVDIARQVLADKIIGRSSHEPSDAIRAIQERASYFAVGPVWETPTKPGRPAPGLSYVRDVVSRLAVSISRTCPMCWRPAPSESPSSARFSMLPTRGRPRTRSSTH